MVTDLRRAQVAQAHALLAEGLTRREAGERMGLRRSALYDLINDPDRKKRGARRARYRKPCPQCGRLMDGTAGPNSSPKLCGACYAAKLKAERRWTPEAIVAALQAFAAAAGRTPSADDTRPTAPSVRARLVPARLAELDADLPTLPQQSAVCREFGTWAAAIDAAGLPRLPVGTPAYRQQRRWAPRGYPARMIERLREGPATAETLAAAADLPTTHSVATALKPWVRRGVVTRTPREPRGYLYALAPEAAAAYPPPPG